MVYNKRVRGLGARVVRMIVAIVLGLGFAGAPLAAPALTVFAAASLQNALEDINRAHAINGRVPARLSFAASSTLARQIERGAPADIYISADVAWTDYLEHRARLVAGSRVVVVRNRLVLIAPAALAVRAESLEIRPGFALVERLGRGRLALGDPAHVPAGRYAKAALESLGLWAPVAGRIAPCDHVRVALALVARGEALLGIVYASDVAAEPAVRVVGSFAPDLHPPIVYPAAIVSGRGSATARAYMALLRSDAARKAFARHGFVTLD